MIEFLSVAYGSIQDEGRKSLRHIGIPTGGVMDRYLSRFANQVVGNKIQDALVEFGLVGPKIRATQDCRVFVAGVDIQVTVNGEEKNSKEVIPLLKGEILDIKITNGSNYYYLAIEGGIQGEKIMDSRSQFEAITSKARIQKGDLLRIGSSKSKNNARIKFNHSQYEKSTFTVHPGPEWHLLSNSDQSRFLKEAFTIKDISRMAITSEWDSITISEITSSPVIPGTIQLTPGGKLLILMNDCQTIGGYSRILQLDEDILHIIAQKKIGEKIRFELKPLDFAK